MILPFCILRVHYKIFPLIPPIKESNDGCPCNCHYEFISVKPTTLKGAIDSKGPILLIKHIEVVGYHHEKNKATMVGFPQLDHVPMSTQHNTTIN
jgi:hypothetical protein